MTRKLNQGTQFAAVMAASFAVSAGLSLGAQAQSESGFDGVWMVEEPARQLLTVDGEMPPLLPEARARYEERVQQAQSGDLSFDDVIGKCAMPGITRVHMMPYPFQIFSNEQRVVFVYEFNHNFRSLELRDQPSIAPWGTGYGRGAASVSADTMTISTNGISEQTFLDAMGMPHSESMTVTETYRLTDNGDRMVLYYTINDPETFSSPWQASLTFRRVEDYDLGEDVCLDRMVDGEPIIDWNREQG